MEPGTDEMKGDLRSREAALEMGAEEFRKLGHQMVDQLATFLESLPSRPVHPAETVAEVRAALGSGSLPEHGSSPGEILDEAARLVFDHSLFNGHPGFMAYVTSSAAPIGALGEFLAATVNANVGAWALSPMASEIETQTIQWIREAIGCPRGYGGLLVSGGNLANFVGFLAARKAKAGWDIRAKGTQSGERRLRLYASRETHTWIQKAADLFGLGTDAIAWISVDKDQKMNLAELEQKISTDRAQGHQPFLVVGSAGTVSTGTVDPLDGIATICRTHDLWFHVDGAYGAFAAMLPEASADLRALAEADSIALDPHKWLYAPLEAGCALVRDPQSLVDAFSFHPEYYLFDQDEDQADPDEPPAFNYYELGPQNSRGFRALKVWLAWRQAGRDGYIRMIRDDIALAKALYDCICDHPELEALTQSLSITTFRYVPETIPDGAGNRDEWLNELNRGLLKKLQSGGQVYLSNAVVDGCFVLRACIVNFRTTLKEIEALPEQVAENGREWLATKPWSDCAPS
jgi:glutamate/tyrosine decarboxylase-like PLP-dependent enzyme